MCTIDLEEYIATHKDKYKVFPPMKAKEWDEYDDATPVDLIADDKETNELTRQVISYGN